jgi:hypothetical protein
MGLYPPITSGSHVQVRNTRRAVCRVRATYVRRMACAGIPRRRPMILAWVVCIVGHVQIERGMTRLAMSISVFLVSEIPLWWGSSCFHG